MKQFKEKLKAAWKDKNLLSVTKSVNGDRIVCGLAMSYLFIFHRTVWSDYYIDHADIYYPKVLIMTLVIPVFFLVVRFLPWNRVVIRKNRMVAIFLWMAMLLILGIMICYSRGFWRSYFKLA